MKRYTRVLIDGNNLVHRMRHAYYGLRSSHKDIPTGTIYGTIKAIEGIIKRFSPDEIVVCWDCEGGSWRADKYSWYKSDRKERIKQETLEEAESRHEFYHTEIPDVKNALYGLGIPQLTVPTMEADDIIAILAWSRPIFINDLIVSTDKDLVQLVRRHLCRILSPHSDRERMFYQHETTGHVMCNGPDGIKDLAPSPKLYLWRKAVMGDPSDSIKGINGVGEVRAAKLLNKPERKAETIDRYLTRMKLNKNTYGKRILDNVATIQRNLHVMDLRFAEWESNVLPKEYKELGLSQLFRAGCSIEDVYNRFLIIRTHTVESKDDLPIFLKNIKADPSKALTFFRRRDFSVAFYPISWQKWLRIFKALYGSRENMYNEIRTKFYKTCSVRGSTGRQVARGRKTKKGRRFYKCNT